MQPSALSLLLIFLRLGLTSFGGPIAHIGYYRREFVERRGWLDEQHFADIVALCQFVPGPSSSQTGFAIGLARGGLPGGLAAWAGFSAPSAALMLLAAYGLQFADNAVAKGLIHGLKIAAVAVVAQAVWSMGRSLCPDRPRAGIAMTAAALLIAVPAGALQLAVIAAGALAGWLFLKPGTNAATPPAAMWSPPRRAAIASLALFFALLAGLPVLAAATGSPDLQHFAAIYRAGGLVFGGGHVVLPLLQEAVVDPGWVSQENFLAGYGAAQALPGPLFCIAAYLGALMPSSAGPLGGAALGLVAIFLPGMLLIYGALPFWHSLRQRPAARSALAGVNAAVVGVLAAALYNPIFISSIERPADLALAVLALAGLTVARLPVLLIVAAAAAGGLAIAQIG